MVTAAEVRAFFGVRPGQNAKCPFHDDSTASLSIGEDAGKLLIHCQAGCKDIFSRVVAMVGNDNGGPAVVRKSVKSKPTAAPKPQPSNKNWGYIEKTYDYQDATGKLAYQVCRMVDPKSFKQRRPDPEKPPGNWVWNLKGVDRVPYRLPEVLKAETVYICEGEKDCDRLAGLGLTATCNSGGAGKWPQDFDIFLKDKKIVILPDMDPPGAGHALDVAGKLAGVAGSIKIVDLPGLPDKGDVSDYLDAGATVADLQAIVATAPAWTPETSPEKPKRVSKFINAKELETMDFPVARWIIPGLLPEGYCLLVGRPKMGKSWLGLSLAVAVSTGGCALGKSELRATQGEVLYLALEDRLRRIKDRLNLILNGEPFPEKLWLRDSLERMDRGGLDEIRGFLEEHPDCRLVVIDTLAKVRPPQGKNSDLYAHDVMVGGILAKLAYDHNTSVLCVHHTRKSAADDPLDTVSGSTGITGSADSILILSRGRGQVDGALSITGRDVEEQDLALKFHPDMGLWELVGDAAKYAISRERQEIVKAITEHGPLTITEVSKVVKKKYDAVRMTLTRMLDAKEVVKDEKGRYKLFGCSV